MTTDLYNIIKSKKGQIVYNDLNYIDFSKNVKNQIDELKEDLLQVQFPNDIILDIGWYPSFDQNGSFRICLIKELDWSNPIDFVKCKNMTELKNNIIKMIKTIGNVR